MTDQSRTKNGARAAGAALSFFTAIPLGRRVAFDEQDLRRGAVLFPAVGALVGVVVATVAWAAHILLPAPPAAILGVASGVAVTAAFHLDGLADVADGIGASLTGRDPAEVMRDPRLGTFGVAAVALDLLLKTSLVAALVAAGFPWVVVAAGALSRVPAIALAWRLPYAGGGTGVWTEGIGLAATLAAAAIALVIAVPAAHAATVWMIVAVAVAALPLAWWSRRRLGGVAGDVFGAAAELGETLALAAAVAAMR
jgi:adenosylcobinamide-GDP ribazoletransferase